jgi:hypothetical protein
VSISVCPQRREASGINSLLPKRFHIEKPAQHQRQAVWLVGGTSAHPTWDFDDAILPA